MDWIRFGPAADGLERADVHLLRGIRAAPSRHYTIGLTTAGVQTFRYRGAQWVSLPGLLVILHPDESHDGVAGTDDGFGYRAVYIAPELIRNAIDGSPLPFVADPVQRVARAARPILSVLADIDEPMDELGCAEVVAAVADSLVSLSGRLDHRPTRIDMRAVTLVREYLTAYARQQTPGSTLEGFAGIDRFAIARHFRRAFGTSPGRYHTLRRLELARSAIESGQSLARAAAESGFADQSHMTRHFKRTYGFTPARWMALTAVARQAYGTAIGH